MTRSQSQKSTCKDLGRAGQRAAITPKAIYAPVSNRAGSRFHKKKPALGRPKTGLVFVKG
ncbi:alpha-galactosidase [Lacticaseibacillus paracasei]|nr:alpha-galactosidase [Lacticaseibacillus paracasei]